MADIDKFDTACCTNDVREVERMIGAGVDVNAGNKDGMQMSGLGG